MSNSFYVIRNEEGEEVAAFTAQSGITDASFSIEEFDIYDDFGHVNGIHVEDLRPLTAEEWWKFAPWQDMEGAPMDNTDILLMCSHGCITGSYRHGAWRSDDNSILLPKKWLPLQVSK